MPRMQLKATVGRMLRGRMATNLLAIYLARAANIIIPLALIPIVARVLEPEVFGLTLLAQAIGLWLTQLVEYGYDFSATRRLAREDWSKNDWKQVVADTLMGQGVLCALCLLGTVGFYFIVEGFLQHPFILILAWFYGVLAGYTPRWYFYAREELAAFTGVSVVSRALGALVSIAGAIWLASGEAVMLGYVIGSLLALAWSLCIIMPKLGGVRWTFKGGLETLREGGGVFVFKLSKMFYSLGGVTVAGIFAPAAAMAQYVASDRLVRAGINLAVSFTIAVFPRLSKLANTDRPAAKRLFFVVLAVSVGLTSLAAVIVTFQAEPIIHLLLGERYVSAAPILAVLIWVAPLNLLQYCLGTQWMLPMGMDRQFSLIISGSVIVYAVLAIWSLQFGIAALAYANLAAEALLCAALLLYLLVIDPKLRRAPGEA